MAADQRSRLPGASAYNSIAVIQKWEHLHPDPLSEVRHLCNRMVQHLRGEVADVIPVSGYLANSLKSTSPGIWETIAELAVESTADAFDDLIDSPEDFRDEIRGAGVSTTRRLPVAESLNWPVLRFAMLLARQQNVNDGRQLCRAIWDASGIERLKGILQSRFFSLAGLIQSSTALRKAWDPCNTALLRLQQLEGQIQQKRRQGLEGLEVLAPLQNQADRIDTLTSFVEDTLSMLEQDIQRVTAIRTELDMLKYQAEFNFRLLDEDLSCLKLLDDISDYECSPDEKHTLQRFLGKDGLDIHCRLGIEPRSNDIAPTIDLCWELHERWSAAKASASRDLSKIYAHAVKRVSFMLDYFEEISNG